MEDIGSEVSKKIRAAISAKLVELGAYIDNELPDYVMVMIANKRTRQQMNEDLRLFLGSNTKTFTSWLSTVLKKLQEVTIADFDSKKEGHKGKDEKKKRSNSEDSTKNGSKSPDEQDRTGKKHMKKGKGAKKLKMSKYKAEEMEKDKDKDLEEKQASTESVENDSQEKSGSDKGTESSQPADSASDDESKDEVTEEGEQNLSDSSVSKVPENVNNSNSEREVTSARSSSPSHFTSIISVEYTSRSDPEEEDESAERNKDEETQDEFNIEPLEKTDDESTNKKSDDKSKVSKPESQSKPTGMIIKAPTRELLKQHDRIIRERERRMSKKRKKSDANSDDSESRDDIIKQTQKRAKKNIPKSQMSSGAKKSYPTGVEVLQTSSKSREETTVSSHRAKRISQRRDQDVVEDENIYNRDGSTSNPLREKSYSPKGKNESDNSRSAVPSTSEPKSNIISISKSLEMEKNLGVKSEGHKKKSGNKTTSSPKKKAISSRIFTIPEPETPEIPSVIKVKPREFVPKDKQASKALILKAVADAEKSVATVQNRNDTDVEPKKPEILLPRNLRGKRFQKLAITLSNLQASGSVADRVKSKRVVSVDSENPNAQDPKTESLKDSELSHGYRSIPDVTGKNISNKSEDQFISSKTSAMEKNDKYIHYWLEGVEKAVKDEEIVNPSEIEDFHISFSDQAGKEEEPIISSTDDDDSENTIPIDDDSYEEDNSGDSKIEEGEGPQIVVTLDGLTSKAIKNIILRNRDLPNGPLLASGSRNMDYIGDEDDDDDDEEEIEIKPGIRFEDSPKDAGTSKQSCSGSADKANKLEKISERFGRINKTSENHEFKEKYYKFERERYEKKYLKYQGTDKEKEKHYEKLKDKYASAKESKNKKLIARLSEKFGKVDRKFDDKKRKYSDDDLRYSYYKKADRGAERDAKYSKRDRNSVSSEKPK